MNQLSEPWRQHIPRIADVLNKAQRVRWDRCIDADGALRIYGWVDREDRHADFVMMEVQRYADVPIIDFSFFTSSPDPDLGAELVKAIGIAIDDHIDCQRIEEVFGGMVTNAIKLKPKECDCEAAIGRDRLVSNRCTDGAKIKCPNCGKEWVHVCDEAEGCSWVPA